MVHVPSSEAWCLRRPGDGRDLDGAGGGLQRLLAYAALRCGLRRARRLRRRPGARRSASASVGYAGDACGDCASGYVLAGGACAPDPASPTRAAEPHKGGVHGLRGRGRLPLRRGRPGQRRRRLVPAHVRREPTPGVRAADLRRLVGGRPLRRWPEPATARSPTTPAPRPGRGCYVRGEFNGWALSDPMALGGDGRYTLVKQLAAGSYALQALRSGPGHVVRGSRGPLLQVGRGGARLAPRRRGLQHPRTCG
ncbi:MAG: hypothetical protein MZV63_09740 [Marinilabiliales bacterium]|nr:hypothetical protein [Marinilabiliales bacterium]